LVSLFLCALIRLLAEIIAPVRRQKISFPTLSGKLTPLHCPRLQFYLLFFLEKLTALYSVPHRAAMRLQSLHLQLQGFRVFWNCVILRETSVVFSGIYAAGKDFSPQFQVFALLLHAFISNIPI
jgi:hypothetical protein